MGKNRCKNTKLLILRPTLVIYVVEINKVDFHCMENFLGHLGQLRATLENLVKLGNLLGHSAGV